MFVALRPGHSLARKRRIRLEDVVGEDWIAGTSPTLTLRLCRDAGFEPLIRYATDHPRIAHGLVARGAGVMFVNGLALSAQRLDLTVRPIAGDGAARDVSAAVLAAEPRLPAVAAFLQELHRTACRYA